MLATVGHIGSRTMRHLLLVPLLVTFLQGCSSFSIDDSGEPDRPSDAQGEDDSKAPHTTLPAIMPEGLDVDPRVYRVAMGNHGVGGSAQRVPDHIHVLGIEGDGTRPEIKRHGQGIALWENRIPPDPRPPLRPESASTVDPLYKKYCLDPSSLTDEEQARFDRLGGVKSIPRSLIDNCRLNK
jgi:hypothetical protein